MPSSVASSLKQQPTTEAAPRSALVIYNPTAGNRRRRHLRQALTCLDAFGIDYTVRTTAAAGDARRIAELANNVDVVVVAGGDGTISEAAGGLVHPDRLHSNACSSPALAIIPIGTANVLAAEIGLGKPPQDAAKAIAYGEIRPAWYGLANGGVFCQLAGVGFDAHVVENVNARLKKRLGKTAYVVETLHQWMRYKPRRYLVDIDGKRRNAASVVIANGHFYAGRYSCVPDASIDAENLSVCLFSRTGRWNVLRYAFGLLTGRIARLSDVEILRGRRIRIAALEDCDANGPVQGDGDIIARLPVDISLSESPMAIVRPVQD